MQQQLRYGVRTRIYKSKANTAKTVIKQLLTAASHPYRDIYTHTNVTEWCTRMKGMMFEPICKQYIMVQLELLKWNNAKQRMLTVNDKPINCLFIETLKRISII